MRHFFNAPLQVTSSLSQFRREDYLLTLVAKASLDLAINGECGLAARERQAGISGPLAFADEIGTSLRYGGDHAPFKPRTDVTLLGRAFARDGGYATALTVTFGIGAWRKSLRVFGDRAYRRQIELELSQPIPFHAMPLRLEYAFGGPGSPFNPWGKGYGGFRAKPGETLPVANIHPAEEQQLRWDSPARPAGFGPLPEQLQPRARLAGTHDEAWLYRRNPLPPEDFDFGFHNSAPEDQQFSPYLSGGETLYFENLHPTYASFTSTLPDLVLRLFINRSRALPLHAHLDELDAPLDTLHIDLDAMRVDLVWRATVATPFADGRDVTDCYVALEPRRLRLPRERHALQFERLILGPPVPPPPPLPTPEAAAAAPSAESEALHVAAFKQQMAGLPLAPALRAALAACTTMAAIERLFEAELLRFAKGLGLKLD
ncbi:DUF2169 family type VI secretion system accessory protein [Acidisoma sp. C75]